MSKEVVIEDKVFEVKAVIKLQAVEEFQSKANKHFFVYWFTLAFPGVVMSKMIKVISEVAPELMRGVELSTFNNAISLRVI